MLELYNKNKLYLRKSKFRSSFKLDEKDKRYVDIKGLEMIQKHAKDFITKRLAPAFPKRDGRQTPYSGHPVFKAQHAIGVCCRHCLEKWYRVSRGIQLDENQINDISKIIIKWIKEN